MDAVVRGDDRIDADRAEDHEHGKNGDDFPANVVAHMSVCRPLHGRALRFDDGRLALVAADRGFRHLDPHFIRDLELDALLTEAGHGPVNAAGGDDAIAHLEGVEKLLHLLLLPLHRQENDEIEDREHENERDELEPRAPAVGSRAHGKQTTSGEELHDSYDWRDKLWWKSSLKLSNRPNTIASLIRLRVSR